MNRRGGFRQARVVAQHDLENAPVVDDHDAGAVAAHSLGQVAGDPPGTVHGMSRRDSPAVAANCGDSATWDRSIARRDTSGMRASMCDRTQSESLPYLRYIESSQV